MKHFTIFQGFYYVIAEMTEEEIVSTISSFTYREKVEEIRRIFAEQGEKAANEKKKELPAIAFSASYRGRRTKVNLVKYMGHIVIAIDHLSRRIGAHPPCHQEMQLHPYRFYQSQRDGRENHSACMPSG